MAEFIERNPEIAAPRKTLGEVYEDVVGMIHDMHDLEMAANYDGPEDGDDENELSEAGSAPGTRCRAFPWASQPANLLVGRSSIYDRLKM